MKYWAGISKKHMKPMGCQHKVVQYIVLAFTHKKNSWIYSQKNSYVHQVPCYVWRKKKQSLHLPLIRADPALPQLVDHPFPARRSAMFFSPTLFFGARFGVKIWCPFPNSSGRFDKTMYVRLNWLVCPQKLARPSSFPGNINDIVTVCIVRTMRDMDTEARYLLFYNFVYLDKLYYITTIQQPEKFGHWGITSQPRIIIPVTLRCEVVIIHPNVYVYYNYM